CPRCDSGAPVSCDCGGVVSLYAAGSKALVMSDLLDPAEEVGARDLLQQLRVGGAPVRPALLDDLVLALGTGDVSTLALDLLGHRFLLWLASVVAKAAWKD